MLTLDTMQDEYPKTHSDDDENDAELAAFREILLESFADVDTENSNMIPVESLGKSSRLHPSPTVQVVTTHQHTV